ncbi:MAG: oligosaccharide flippase family protein, partial [Chloroflexi bacterium]|nr:oligosaccharide flippase family protein [Chloroflexota bacterium]
MAAAFIPVYSAYLTSAKAKETAQLANTILTLVLAILGGVSLVGAIFAPWITRVILVPGFAPEQQALTADLMRIILIQTTIFWRQWRHQQHPQRPSTFHIAGPGPHCPQCRLPDRPFPLSADAGNCWPGLGYSHRRRAACLDSDAWSDQIQGLPAAVAYPLRLSGVTEIVRLMIPRIVTLGTVQAADLFIIRITSGLVSGATSGYFYGYYLQQLPETLFGTAIAVVLFPTMAERYNAGDIPGLKQVASTGLRIIWLLTVPSAAALILLGRPLISLLLERGEFTAESTSLVYG